MIFTELIFRITLEQDVTEFHIEYFLARISESLVQASFLTLSFDVENGQNILERNRKMKEKLS